MSERTFLITYTGTNVVELKGAGVFGPGISAFVGPDVAETAKGQGDFKVEERTPPEPLRSTREELDKAAQGDDGGSADAPKAAAPAPAPAKEEPKPAAAPAGGKDEAKGKDEPKDKDKDEGGKPDAKKEGEAKDAKAGSPK